MQAPSTSTIVIAAMVPLIAWRVYMRFKRAVGRQRLAPARPWITMSIFSLVVLFLVFAARAHVESLEWLALGLGAGACLGLFGLSKTQFDPTPEGLFFTPNAHLGIALSILFLVRMAYRLVEVYSMQAKGGMKPPDFSRHPMTLGVFGLLAGYYITYAIGLVRWRSRALQALQPSDSPAAPV